MVWEDYRDGDEPEIYYKIGLNHGESWSDDIRLTNTNASRDPCLAANDKGVHILCIEKVDYTDELYYYQVPTDFIGIISLNFSKTLLQLPDAVVISIKGASSEENIADVQCKVQSRSPSGNWTDVHADFVSDHWEAIFTLDATAELGSYDFRAKLISQSGNESYWFENLDIIKAYEDTKDTEKDNVPGFELSLFIFSIVVLLILIKKHRLRK